MLDLVNHYRESADFQDIYPSSSHEALGLSKFEDYPTRCEHPMIYIKYVHSSERFEVSWQRGQGNTVSKSSTNSPKDTEFINSVVSWLN